MAEAKGKYTLVLNRNFVLRTTKGHSVEFEKGVPIHVPPAIYQDALSIGAQPPDGTEVVAKEEVKTSKAPSDPAERAPQIMEAIKLLVAEGTRENFTAAGAPTADAISKLLDYKVQNKEVAVVWQQYHDEKAKDK